MQEVASPPLWRRLLPLLGFGLAALVIYKLDRASMLRALARLSPAAIVLAAAAMTFNVLVKGLRWKRLLEAQGIAITHRQAMGAFLEAAFYGSVTIGRVGEFMRVERLMG